MGIMANKRLQFNPGAARTVGDLVTCAAVSCGRCQSRSSHGKIHHVKTKLRSVHRAYLSILSDSHSVDPSLALRHDHPISLHQART